MVREQVINFVLLFISKESTLAPATTIPTEQELQTEHLLLLLWILNLEKEPRITGLREEQLFLWHWTPRQHSYEID